jgi:hypothetical protein
MRHHNSSGSCHAGEGGIKDLSKEEDEPLPPNEQNAQVSDTTGDAMKYHCR